MFLKVFLRCGRFTTQFARIDFNTRPTLGAAATLTLPRKAHMISRLFLVTTMPDIKTPQLAARAFCSSNSLGFVGPTIGWTNSLGHALITEASIDIGGTRCERLDGRLLEVLDEFYTPLEKTSLTSKILKRVENGFVPGCIGGPLDTSPVAETTTITPLPFWFSCGDAGAFLPIDAIQTDSVVLRVNFAPLANLYVSTQGKRLSSPGASVAGDAYAPLVGAPFYYSNSAGSSVYDLPGTVSAIPGITIPSALPLGDTYVIAEYVYLEKPEAYRFRIADIRIAVPQHYPIEPVDTERLPRIQIPLKIPNPTRNLFFMAQRYEAARYNAPFLATRDLAGVGTGVPWWPDAQGLTPYGMTDLSPGFSTRESEPFTSIRLVYEGKLVRYWTDSPSIFRSLIPSLEMKKSPWVNRYYYSLGFGFQHGLLPPSVPSGEANLDKMTTIELQLDLHLNKGTVNPNDVPRYFIYVWAETYNILRVYGGRAGFLFGY